MDSLIPIVAIGLPMMIPIVAIWTKHQRQMAEIRSRNGTDLSAEQAAISAQRIAALEERVKVLERIVTDGSTSLANQIEALRDTAPLPPVTPAATRAPLQDRL